MGRPGGARCSSNATSSKSPTSSTFLTTCWYLDAPSVEAWLDRNDGGRHDRGYTVYFVNWYGRPDFRFHVYGKTDEPDRRHRPQLRPQNDSRRMTAWGGSSGRISLHDLSAGPEAWTGKLERRRRRPQRGRRARLPHPSDLGGRRRSGIPATGRWLGNDLGVVTRFVANQPAVHLVAALRPAGYGAGRGGAKVAHVAMFEDDDDAKRLGWTTSMARSCVRGCGNWSPTTRGESARASPIRSTLSPRPRSTRSARSGPATSCRDAGRPSERRSHSSSASSARARRLFAAISTQSTTWQAGRVQRLARLGYIGLPTSGSGPTARKWFSCVFDRPGSVTEARARGCCGTRRATPRLRDRGSRCAARRRGRQRLPRRSPRDGSRR